MLDGNHRAVAVAVARVPFRALIVAIDGPLDPGVLPDLAHFHGVKDEDRESSGRRF